MMERINNIKQLNRQKQQLVQRQAELKKAIRYDWIELKKNLKPDVMMEDLLRDKGKEQTQTIRGSMIAWLLARITTKLIHKMAGRARTKR